ncbi:MAG: carbon monoxide dehydrogenase, partial [Desulfosudaceae bacterium]
KSRRGLEAAVRIHELAMSLNIGMKKSYLILNQARSEPTDKVQEIVEKSGLELAGSIPADDTLTDFDFEGRPTIELPADNPALQAAYAIFDQIIP